MVGESGRMNEKDLLFILEILASINVAILFCYVLK